MDFFEKQIKIRQLWVIWKHQRTSSLHETTGKEPTVRKVFFLKISKQLRTQVLNQNPVLCTIMRRPQNMCKKTRKSRAGQCSMGVFSVSQKEQGKLSLAPNLLLN
jgi:hypothetical protein